VIFKARLAKPAARMCSLVGCYVAEGHAVSIFRNFSLKMEAVYSSETLLTVYSHFTLSYPRRPQAHLSRLFSVSDVCECAGNADCPIIWNMVICLCE
jgi:hypothetical protein